MYRFVFIFKQSIERDREKELWTKAEVNSERKATKIVLKMKFAIESAECYDVMNRPRDVSISSEYLGQFESVVVKNLELR